MLTDHDPTSKLPVIIVGGGGHAKVVASALLLQHHTVLGFVDVNPVAPPMLGIANLGNDDKVFDYSPDLVRLVNGVGSIKSTALRQTIYERFVAKQYFFETVIHPNAVVSLGVEIGAGVQITGRRRNTAGQFAGSQCNYQHRGLRRSRLCHRSSCTHCAWSDLVGRGSRRQGLSNRNRRHDHSGHQDRRVQHCRGRRGCHTRCTRQRYRCRRTGSFAHKPSRFPAIKNL